MHVRISNTPVITWELTATMASSPESPVANNKFHFHNFDVTHQVFHATALSFAFVNLKPLLPGHVLVSPRRRVTRFTQLTDAEAADLFVTAKRVARTLERVYSATGFTVPLQDGFDAGQSVPHVHIHLLPRHPADLDHEGGPDAIYDRLEGNDGDIAAQLFAAKIRKRPRQPKVDEDALLPRSDEEMAAEADVLRAEMAKDLS